MIKKRIRILSLVVAFLLLSSYFYPTQRVEAAAGFYSTAKTTALMTNVMKASFGTNNTYSIMQGGCTDEKGYAYFYMKNTAKEADKEKGKIVKINISTKEVVKKSETLNLNHGNDMTYNVHTNRIVVTNSNTKKLSIINPATLVCEKTITTDQKYYSISYDKINKRYAAGVGGTYDTVIMDSNFKVVKSFKGKDHGYLKQGMDCDENYIYYIQSPKGNNTDNSIIVVYDWNGNHIQNINVNGKKEAENLFHSGSDFYIGYYTKNASEFHKIEFKNSFTILYNASGGTGTMSNTVVSYGTGIALRKNQFSYVGHHFTGWKVYNNDTKMWYSVNSTTNQKVWMTAADMKAKGFTPFLYGDGEVVAKTTSKNAGKITLYATWDPNQYLVAYNANGGTGNMDITKVTYGKNTQLRANAFTKTGYHFTGWNASRIEARGETWYCEKQSTGEKKWLTNAEQKAKGFTRVLYPDKTTVAKTTSVEGATVTMHAKWAANTYTITYHANGGKGTMADTKVTYGTNTTLRANSFKYSGKTFKGWYAKRMIGNTEYWFCSDATKTQKKWLTNGDRVKLGYVKEIYLDKTSVSKTSSIHGDKVVMYAVWK